MPSCTLSPDLVNFPSGISTSLPPKPRKPPVLRRIARTLPSGPASTLCTEPSLLPSDEKTLRPIIGFFDGAADCRSVADGAAGVFIGSEGFIPVGGVGAGSGLTAGGVVCASGAGVCVCAAAVSAAALDRRAAAPMRRRRVSVVMMQSPFVVAALGTTPHRRKGCAAWPPSRRLLCGSWEACERVPAGPWPTTFCCHLLANRLPQSIAAAAPVRLEGGWLPGAEAASHRLGGNIQ